MSRPVLYVAVTAHGFGHAVRSASIVAEVIRLNPEILPIMVTTSPRWLLESYIDGEFIHRPRGYDVGVIQADSIRMDKEATGEKWRLIRGKQNPIVAGEVDFIRTNRVGLVLADIPPLATVIARAAGVPCWMVGNFGWDFIYEDWGTQFQELTAWIRQCYGYCDRLFKLPLAESMSSFPVITEAGLTGGNPRFTPEDMRAKFPIKAPPEKTVLLTFGGLGLQAIPYENIKKFPDWQFITFDTNAPDLPNLIKVSGISYRPVDFMPLCGRIISKPGYSTFAEALRLDIPIVSLIREGFAESPILLSGIEQYSHHQIIDTETFFNRDWQFLHRPLQPSRSFLKLPKNGSEFIAKAIVDFFS
ncbi:MAG: hypothetical protein N5P05_001637 [Chroococcopsis gigantea SAG 12.99]|jgi:hypothetical protein|nr:hypothetical protein [Chroococcopsis gigantea SAG 12.99]